MLHCSKALTALVASATTFLAIQAQDDMLGYQDTPVLPGTKWHVHDGLRPQPTVVTPGAAGSPPRRPATR